MIFLKGLFVSSFIFPTAKVSHRSVSYRIGTPQHLLRSATAIRSMSQAIKTKTLLGVGASFSVVSQRNHKSWV